MLLHQLKCVSSRRSEAPVPGLHASCFSKKHLPPVLLYPFPCAEEQVSETRAPGCSFIPGAPFSQPASEPCSLGNKTDTSENASRLRQLGQPHRVPRNCFCLGHIQRAISEGVDRPVCALKSQALCHDPPSRHVDDSEKLWPGLTKMAE